MARPRRTPAPVVPTGLVASAVRLPKVTEGRIANGEAWQASAWNAYDSCPELRFVANWVGSIMSRAELRAVREAGASDETLSEGAAFDTLAEYFDGQMGQAEMLRQTGIHLTVAGECYHYYRADLKEWRVLAAGKVKQQGTGPKARITADWDGQTHVCDNKKDLIIRVWNPHPMDPSRADSPTRANLDVLGEISACSKHIQATLTSRLAGNGILFLPQDITFPMPADVDPASSSADVFMAVLGEAMMTPINDPDSAAAVVPIVVQAPGDSLSQIKHMTFWSPLDDNVRDMRDAAVKRLALGMDIPPEVLLGLSDANHWNAWLVDEASIKAHTEPRLAVVANAITTAFLRPALEGVVDGINAYGIIADTSNLRLRPNRSREAIELYDRGALTEDALLRETGFESEDKPERSEFMEWLLRKIALGSTSPEQTQAAIEALGANLQVEPGEAKERSTNTDNVRSLNDHPERAVDVGPGQPRDEALLAACDVLVYRALERAGNRLKSAANYTGKAHPADLYLEVAPHARNIDTLLSDSWSCLPRVLGESADPDTLLPLLDGYVRTLLTTQTPHSREALSAVLTQQPKRIVAL